MLKRIAFLAFFILLLAQPSTATPYIAVTEPALQDSVVVVQGENLVLGQRYKISILAGDSREVLIDNLPGQVTAFAFGDLNGDLRNELVVALGSAGAVYSYVERDGTWLHEGTQYLWDTIRLLEIHDLNSDGWGDVVVMTEKGEAHVLISQEGTLVPYWRSPAGEVVVGIEVLDVDHNGFPDLIYALRSGYIAVLTWVDQQISTLWENYPWGSVESLVVLPHSTSPEWLVVTSQKMLYGWRWRNGEVVSSRLFEAKALGERLFYFPEEGLLSLSKTTGISLFKLQSSTVEEIWRVPGLYGEEVFYYQGEFYFRDDSNSFSRLVEGSSRWRIFLHDMEITDVVAVANSGGQLYLNLIDLLDFLEITQNQNNPWRFVVPGGEVTLRPHSNEVGFGEISLPLSHPILEAEGDLYVTADVFPALGWQVEFDYTRQHVVLRRNWGWWL